MNREFEGEKSSPLEMYTEPGSGSLSIKGMSNNPGYDIVVQLRKSVASRIGTACYQKTYQSRLKGAFNQRGVGLIQYDIHLEEPVVSLNPTTPPEVARYTNAVKVENPARGEIIIQDMGPPKRVQFTFYRVFMPNPSGDTLVLQLKKAGITDFSPSGRNLTQQVKERVRAVAEEIINRESRGRLKSVPLFSTTFSFDIGGNPLALELKAVKILEDLLAACIVDGGSGKITPTIDFTNGLDFALIIDETKVQKIFRRCWDAGMIQRKYKDGGYTVTIREMNISLGNGFARVEGYGYIDHENLPGGGVRFDYKADVYFSIDSVTNKLAITVDEVKINIADEYKLLIAIIIGIILPFLSGIPAVVIAHVLCEIIEGMIEEEIEDIELVFPLDLPAIPGIPMEVKLTEIEIFNDGTTSGVIIRGTFVV